MLVALHSVLRDGQEAGYDEVHAEIPADILASLRRVGIENWQIWRSGRHVFHLVQCDDFGAAMRALEDDPANVRWQAFIGAYVDHFETTGDRPEDMPIREVWELRRQVERGS